jgi:hypothetical protein
LSLLAVPVIPLSVLVFLVLLANLLQFKCQ